jgi:Flp pilus assembly protein TadD
MEKPWMHDDFWSSEDYDERAHSLFDAGDLDGALETLKEGLALYPTAVDLYVGLGYARLAREEFAWARRAFQRALGLEPDHEDAMVGLGEVLLRFGHRDEALVLFRTVEEMGYEDDVELMLTMGRALYREGLFAFALDIFLRLSTVRPDAAEAIAASGYALHRMGDEVRAARYLRRALRIKPELHEAQVYLGHLLYDRGDWSAALQAFESVPPSEHWDALAVWRLVELKRSESGLGLDDFRLAPWLQCLEALETLENDPVDRLLAEVEARFSGEGGWPLRDESQLELFEREQGCDEAHSTLVRVRIEGGTSFQGPWRDVVRQIRDAAGFAHEPLARFMRRLAESWHQRMGSDVPLTNAESFLRGAAEAGVYELEILQEPESDAGDPAL